MSKAKPITEAFTGPELAVLQKYHLVDDTGEIRMIELRDPKDQTLMRRLPPSPIVAPDVLTRLLGLDQTPDKHILDWIFYTAGGGARAMQASEQAVEQAHEWTLKNRMGTAPQDIFDRVYADNPEAYDEFAQQAGFTNFKEMRRRGKTCGINSDYLPIPPMTEEQAEAEWAQDEPVFKQEYFYCDEDIAKDTSKPFGYFQQWPGRDGVYERIERSILKLNELNSNPNALKLYNKWVKSRGEQPVPGFGIQFVDAHGNAIDPDQVISLVGKYQKVITAVMTFQNIITSEKKKISQYNKLMPNQPFKTTLADYEDTDDLVEKVNNFTRNFARLRALANVQFHGKAPAPAQEPAAAGEPGAPAQPAGPKYTKGPNEVIYDDEFMTVVIPATAGAALKKGWNDWCIANRTRFDDYFKTGDPDKLYWAHPTYGRTTRLGVFGFWTFKVPMLTRYTNDRGQDTKYQQLAGFFRLNPDRKKGNVQVTAIEWTDRENSPTEARQVKIQDVEREMAQINPRMVDSFHRSVNEVIGWINQHDPKCDIERAPALEHLARKLVAMMIGEARGKDGTLRL